MECVRQDDEGWLQIAGRMNMGWYVFLCMIAVMGKYLACDFCFSFRVYCILGRDML